MFKLLSIIFFSSFPYLLSLRGDFVFDDSEAIVKNKDVYSSSWTNPFSNDFWGTNIKSNLSHKSYRPLTVISFRLNFLLGEQLIAHHFKITNLLCHVLCCILAWQTFRKLLKANGKQKWWQDKAYLSALLFSVHPIHVEAVSGIVGRADILAGITFFLAFLTYDKVITPGTRFKFLYLTMAILISGISMLFKENGITILGFCIVYELVTKFKMKRIEGWGADSIVRICVVTIALALLLYGRWAIMGGTKPQFKPIDNPAAFADNTLQRHITLAISLMVMPFLPAANIFYSVGFVIAERVLYISSAGYCLLVVIGLGKIIQRKTFSKIGVSLYLILLVTFALRSWQRSQEWRTEYILFTSGLSVCPLNAKVHYNVAKVADANHSTGWALQEYRTAIRLYPEYYQAMNNLANLLKNQKQYEEAEFYLRKAVDLKQDFPAAWMNLGIVLANTKRYKESHDAYNMALHYRSKYPDCYYNLGNLHLEMNESEAAMDTWFEAINISPKHNLAWTNLLALLDNTGQIQKALQVIPRALKELPHSPSVNFAIANVYGKIDRYEDAERHFLRAIKLFDTKVQAIHYANLGVLYHRWKKFSLAKEMYEESLRIDPQFKSASKNLQSLRKYLKNK